MKRAAGCRALLGPGLTQLELPTVVARLAFVQRRELVNGCVDAPIGWQLQRSKFRTTKVRSGSVAALDLPPPPGRYSPRRRNRDDRGWKPENQGGPISRAAAIFSSVTPVVRLDQWWAGRGGFGLPVPWFRSSNLALARPPFGSEGRNCPANRGASHHGISRPGVRTSARIRFAPSPAAFP